MRLLHWWPSMLTLAAVLWLTLAPDPVPDTGVYLFPHADKVVHAIMFGGLTGALLFDWRRMPEHRSRPIPRQTIAIIALIVAVFATLDECAQSAMALGRYTDMMDLLSDWTGIIVAVFTAPPLLGLIFRNR